MSGSKTIFLAFTLVNTPIAKYFLKLSDEMILRGYKVVIITSNRKTQKVSPDTNPAIYTWPSFRPTRLKDALFLVKLIKQYRPTAILSNFVSDNICLSTAYLMRIPVRAFHQHSTFSNYHQQNITLKVAYKIWRKKQLYRLATFCFPVSMAIAEEAKSIFQIPESKINLFYNALEDPLDGCEPSQKISLKLLCVGQLIQLKGQDVLIKAMKIIISRYPHVKLTLLGDGPEKQTYQRLIDQSGLASHISLAGNVSHSKVIELMASAILVIVPSRAEAFGYVVIEAMSVCTPVIASNVGGIPEIIRDGVDGFLVPPGDPKALAERISVVLDNPNLQKKMGVNARQRFLERFELTEAAKHQADWLEKEIHHNIMNYQR